MPMDKRPETVSRAVVELISLTTKLDLRISEIADRIGVTETTIWRWFAGTRTPVLKHVLRIQREFGISVDKWDQFDDRSDES